MSSTGSSGGPTRGWRVVLVVFGAVLALIGFAALLAGSALVWAHGTQRDDAGFYSAGPHRFSTPTPAITSEHVDLGTDVREGDWAPFDDLGTARITAESATGEALFLGIGPADDVEQYLAGVAHDEVTDVSLSPFDADYARQEGGDAVAPPAEQTFWVASVVGPGEQSLRWEVESGDWMIVLMNADASPGVAADVSAGIRTDLLLPIGLGIGAFGLLALGGGAALLIVGFRREAEQPAAAVAAEPVTAAEGEPVATPYPARLDGHLDVGLSRWLWLVKWLLVLPHVVVLAFLWLAAAVLTVVAGFAILLTGRYPRSMFDFNVGVMRWTWRVGFYAFAAFGTDRYPPFSLRPDPSYPADLDVDHPERLSRGLVLVKWWLLAIPHYLIVGVFAGGWGAGWPGEGWFVGSGGLISVVAFVAALLLLVRGRYPRELFHFVMGLNRWVLRVSAYALLMRDEYPPFRFDGGGTDPGSVHRQVPPPPPPASPAREEETTPQPLEATR